MAFKKTLYYIILTALFLIPIFPFIVTSSLFAPFIVGKVIYFRVLIELAFSAWIILALLDAEYRPRFSLMTLFVSLFTFVVLMADFAGADPIRSLLSNFERMEGWIMLIHAWAFYIVVTSVFVPGKKHLWHRWFNLSLTIASIVTIYGLFQWLGWVSFHQNLGRIDATFGNSIYLATYILFHVFIAAYMYSISRSKQGAHFSYRPYVYVIAMLLFAFGIFETATRGSILGLLVGIFVSLCAYSILGKKEPRKWRIISGSIIGCIFIIFIIFILNRNSPFVQRTYTLNRLASISWNDTSNQARQYIWAIALKGIAQHPILGWGQENFNYVFNSNYNPAMYAQEQWFDRAHNSYLDWFIASGLIGLLIYLGFYVLFLIYVWKSQLNIIQKSIFTGLLVAHAVHALFIFDTLADYIFFFAMLGFVNQFSLRPVRIADRVIRVDVINNILAPVVILLCVGVLYVFNVRVFQANMHMTKAVRSCTGSDLDGMSFQKALDINTRVATQIIREQLFSCATILIANPQISALTKVTFFNLVQAQTEAQIAITPADARIYAPWRRVFKPDRPIRKSGRSSCKSP